jgi:Ca-activated chloride channel family protein
MAHPGDGLMYSYPQFLNWPWVVGAMVLGSALLLLRQYLAYRRAFSRGLTRRFGPGLSWTRAIAKLALWAAGAAALALALAGPLGPPIREQEETEGADVILAVDVSASMLSMDVRPNRLQALKSELSRFIDGCGGDRVGLVAFAGQPVVACPLTSDYETAQLFLDKLDNDSVPIDGTALGRALALCLDRFPPDPKRGRMIVLATDGEETMDSDLRGQARRCADAGIPVFTVGIGTEEGGMVPGSTDAFGRVFAKTYHGEPVRSRLNEATLREVASITGGQFFRGSSGDSLAAALQRLHELKKGKTAGAARFTREPLYQAWLWWAFWLLLAESLISQKGNSWVHSLAQWSWSRLRPQRKAFLGLLAAGAFFFLTGFSLDPGRSEYDQGNQAFRQGAFDKAAQDYQESLSQKGRQCAEYNLGEAYFKQGDYQAASEAFQKAVDLDPKDQDAAFNLDLARRMQEQQKQDDKQGKNQKQKQKQNQPQQQNQDSKSGSEHQKGGSGQEQSKGGGQEGSGKSDKADQSDRSDRSDSSKGSGQAQQGGGSERKPLGMNPDEAQAMMNMLANDQKRFADVFQPLKKRQQQRPQDPFEQMFEQMSGMKLPPAQQEANRGDVKDW